MSQSIDSSSLVDLVSALVDAARSNGADAADAVAVLEGLGLTSNGVALDYAIVGNVVTASTAAGDVFTFETPAGKQTYTVEKVA